MTRTMRFLGMCLLFLNVGVICWFIVTAIAAEAVPAWQAIGVLVCAFVAGVMMECLTSNVMIAAAGDPYAEDDSWPSAPDLGSIVCARCLDTGKRPAGIDGYAVCECQAARRA